MLKKIFLITMLLMMNNLVAMESNFHGIIDVRASSSDSINSYLHGGYGKFSLNDGESLSLAQLGLDFSANWNSGVSAHVVLNGYADDEDSLIGVTEAFLKYKGLPNEYGYRWQAKLGIFYPDISLENDAFAWASKHTLNASSLNTWVGEEIRALGSELSLIRLGRMHNDPYDLSLSVSVFANNDPAGALISWHGWTISQRQTLWTETRELPAFQAREPGNSLAAQASHSDPFLEVDDRLGFHAKGEIKLHQQGEFSLGYYDNNAKPYIEDNGQYAWKTRFMHLGTKWQLPLDLELTSQYLVGDTLMQNHNKVDMVVNDYASGFVMLSKRLNQHRFTMRLEEFSVTDNDDVIGDDNSEYGKSATFNYTNRLSKHWFIAAEYLWINSTRAARVYINEPEKLIEKQMQLSARYFF